MDHDLTIMIYGALMGVVSSILTSLVTTSFQFWLTRREYERRLKEEREKQVSQIYLPTGEEIIAIISQGQIENNMPASSHKVAEAGSLILSILLGSVLVYQTRDAMLGFAFAAILGFLFMNRVIRFLRR
jgi:hypothetical protein